MRQLLSNRSLGLLSLIFFSFAVTAGVNKFDLLQGNRLDVDNVRIDGSVVSTTNTNGDLTITPNGTGKLIYTPGTATTVPYLDASKKLTSSSVTPTELGFLSGVTASLCGISQSCTLTNKTVDAASNTISNISNTEIKAAAAIAVNKLAAVTASRALTSDASGFISPSAVTSTELGFSSGVTSSLCGISQSCTLTNKTLTTPIVDVLTLDGQLSAPSNPAAGFFKIWVDDTTGKPKIINSAGTTSALGGGGGSAGINILVDSNPDAESGTVGWTASGGTFATTNTAANVGNGLAGFSWDASAASQTLTSTITVIPSALYGSYCLLEFYYKGFDSNVTAQVYDGTNVIAAVALSAQTNFYRQRLNFVCPSSGNLQMRLITSADAAIGYFDQVHLGSATNVISDVITTEWTSYTPTGSWSSNTTYTGFWRRVGDSMEVDVNITTSGAPTSASLTVNIPGGYTIDTAKLTSVGSDQRPLGVASILDAAVNGYNGLVLYSSTTAVRVAVNVYNPTSATNPLYTTNNGVTQALPFSFGASDQVLLHFSVPIVGWSALGQAMINDAPLDTTGMVIPYASSTCPANTLPADGAAVSRTTYAQLYAKIGVTHGQGDGSTTFNVPDYRGRFLRGADNYGSGAASRDNGPTRSAMNTGGNSSGVGSVQADAFQWHSHLITDSASGGNTVGRNSGAESFGVTFSNTGSTVAGTKLHAGGGVEADGSHGTPTTSSETVPKNAAVIWCVVTGGAKPTSMILSAPTVQVLSGSGTYTKPAAARYIKIKAVGPGGGGGGVANAAGASAGGGGAGGYCEKTIAAPSATYSYVVGTGGGGAASSNSAGANGSADTTFGSYTAGKGSGGSGSAGPSAVGGAGGAGSGCDVNVTGGYGGRGMNDSTGNGVGGSGGGSIFGGGGYGGQNGNGAPTAGVAYGSGGGGGGANAGTQGGAAGANGTIIVEEYY